MLRAVVCALMVFSLTPPATGQEKKEPYRDAKTGFVFGDVAGFARRAASAFDDERLGYSIGYFAKSGCKATVYVYDYGRKGIPDGCFSKQAREHAKASRSGVFAAEKAGHYQKVEDISRGVVVLGDDERAPRARKMTFRVRIKNRDYISQLFVTARKKHFVKMRITYPAEKQPQCEKELLKLLDAVGRSIKPRKPGDNI